MKIKKLFKFASIFFLYSLFVLAFSSCEGTPDNLSVELEKKIGSIATPTNLRVVNNHQDHSMSLSWDPVEGASYYSLEYERANDFQNAFYNFDDGRYNEIIVNGTQYELKNIAGITGIADKRLVFRVKANTIDQKGEEIRSMGSSLAEGALLDEFITFTATVSERGKVTFHYEIPETASVLNVGSDILGNSKNIEIHDVTSEPTITEGNRVYNGISIGSKETKKYEAIIKINGEEVGDAITEVESGVIKFPPPVFNITPDDEYLENIATEGKTFKISFDTYGLNKGLGEDEGITAELNILVEKKVDDGRFQKVSDLSLEDVTKETEPDEDGVYHLSFDARDIGANSDYTYRITPYYSITEDGVKYDNYGDSSDTKSYHMPDTELKEIRLARRPVSRPVTETEASQLFSRSSGEDEYKTEYSILINWDQYHNIDWDKYSLKFTEIEVETDFNSEEEIKSKESKVVILDKQHNEAELKGHYYNHKILIDSNSDPKMYAFALDIISNENKEAENPKILGGESKHVMDSLHGDQSTVAKVNLLGKSNLILEESLEATPKTDQSAIIDILASSVKLSWEMNQEEIENLKSNFNLNNNQIEIHIYRSVDAGDTVYLTPIKYNGQKEMEYYDDTVEPGVHYYYSIEAKVRAVTDQMYLMSHTAQGYSLGRVENVKASKNRKQIDVTWESLDNVTGYIVYYSSQQEPDKYQEKIISNEDELSTTTALTIDDGIIPGENYNVFVSATDNGFSSDKNNRHITKKSESTDVSKGKILGIPKLSVTNKYDSVELTWDKEKLGEGEEMTYALYVYRPGEDSPVVNNYELKIEDSNFKDNGNIYTYEFKSDFETIKNLSSINIPYLSQEYSYLIRPTFKENSQSYEAVLDSSKAIRGHWAIPPVNIRASKAEYNDQIEVKWDPVTIAGESNIDYYLYYREKGSKGEYAKATDNSISGNSCIITSIGSDKSLDKEYEFTVQTHIANLGGSGPLQDVFENSKNENLINVGYILKKPTIHNPSENMISKDGLYTFRIDEVKGATKYEIISETLGTISFTKDNIGNYELAQPNELSFVGGIYEDAGIGSENRKPTVTKEINGADSHICLLVNIPRSYITKEYVSNDKFSVYDEYQVKVTNTNVTNDKNYTESEIMKFHANPEEYNDYEIVNLFIRGLNEAFDSKNIDFKDKGSLNILKDKGSLNILDVGDWAYSHLSMSSENGELDRNTSNKNGMFVRFGSVYRLGVDVFNNQHLTVPYFRIENFSFKGEFTISTRNNTNVRIHLINEDNSSIDSNSYKEWCINNFGGKNELSFIGGTITLDKDKKNPKQTYDIANFELKIFDKVFEFTTSHLGKGSDASNNLNLGNESFSDWDKVIKFTLNY